MVPMALNRVDSIQVRLAWLFVGCQLIHALIMLGWNFVPYRFAAYSAGCMALMALALQVGPRCWPAG